MGCIVVFRSYTFRIALLVLLQVLLASNLAFSADEKATALRKTSLELMDVGNALYSKGMYTAAEQQFVRASENKQYLSESEQKKLADMLDKARIAVVERQKVSAQVRAADALAKQKSFIEAGSKLATIKDSPYLTKAERTNIEADIKAYQAKSQQYRADMLGIYNQSVAAFDAGKLDEAKKGFEQVAASGLSLDVKPAPQEFLAKIEASSESQVQTAAAEKAEVKPATMEVELLNDATAKNEAKPADKPVAKAEPAAAVAEPAKAEQTKDVNTAEVTEVVAVKTAAPSESNAPMAIPAQAQVPAGPNNAYMDRLMQQRNIQRSYTEAVVEDAVNRASTQSANGQFEAARESLSSANRVVENNRTLLGDDDYRNFVSRILAARNSVDSAAANAAAIEQRNQQEQAAALQRDLRTRQEIERQQRIDDLMTKAVALQREQRYEDSLAQLDLLLAIDPLNEQAKVMHKTLEDMVSLRKQLETKAEIDKATLDTMLQADKAQIPHTDAMTYPRDWREIVNKRTTEEMGGLSPVDAAVQKQLDQTVDLSKLNADMSFGEAIDVLRNSVEPPVKIVPIWKDLQDNAEIDRTTKINMEPVSAVPLGRGLDLLLSAVSGGLVKLGYVIQDGVITIATQAALPAKTTQQMYDITDLLDLPAEFETDMDTAGLGEVQQVGGTGGGGASGSRNRQQSSNRQEQEQGPEAQATRIQDIMTLIQETISPESWYVAGGEGTMQVYGKKLIVSQTPEVHRAIAKLINDLRANLGQQVSIEARFLLVDENFLEDVGVDADFIINAGSHWQPISVFQDSISNTTGPGGTRVPSSLGGRDNRATPPAAVIQTGYGGILDDLQVQFLIKATQTHRNSRSLEAPKLTVLSGESATLRISTDRNYISNIEFEQSSTTGDSPIQFITATRTISSVSSGAILNITPTITANKKYVLLRITTGTTELLALDEFKAGTLSNEGNALEESFFVPTLEITEVRTRVSVPDGGTLLLGGQKLTGEVEKESGVPGLSKIPLLGRLFSNRSTVRDHRVLLILVTPTIILQDEREAEAISGLTNSTK